MIGDPPHRFHSAMTAATGGQAFSTWFGDARTLVILRGYDLTTTLALANRAWDLGVSLVEVPISGSASLDILKATVAAGRERNQVVGAGTVLSVADVDDVVAAGAQFTVAPGWNAAVAGASHVHRLPHLPGVMTPSEIQAAIRAGFTWVKLFPAAVLGPKMLGSLRGPFPNVHFVATGGIDETNARTFIEHGASAISLGSAIVNLTDSAIRELHQLASERKSLESL